MSHAARCRSGRARISRVSEGVVAATSPQSVQRILAQEYQLRGALQRFATFDTSRVEVIGTWRRRKSQAEFGCERTMTFDRTAAKTCGMTSVR
jgi:hypothetical protein